MVCLEVSNVLIPFVIDTTLGDPLCELRHRVLVDTGRITREDICLLISGRHVSIQHIRVQVDIGPIFVVDSVHGEDLGVLCRQLQLPFTVDPHGSAVSKRVGELPVTCILALISRFKNRVGAVSSLFNAFT